MSTEVIIGEQLAAFVADDPGNSLAAHGGMVIYDAPLVSFAAADDPLFARLKEPDVVGPHHLLPGEWLAGARSVISYFLPFTEAVRASNRQPGLPSEEWVSARIDGEAFNVAARKMVVAMVERLGGQGIAPALDPRFKIQEVTSNWSERHVGYVAGLGTFGLHRHLITARGSAGRIGSVVTTLELTPTLRSYEDPYEYCLWFKDGSCGNCLDRCSTGALTEGGKDKYVCKHYLEETVMAIFKPRYGCAKCQVAVPCEDSLPADV
jgi:epoxyqueuosine reductase QueG